jgi:hypothetical protein
MTGFRAQATALAGLSIWALTLALLLGPGRNAVFEPYLGRSDPFLVLLLLSLLALAAIPALQHQGGLMILQSDIWPQGALRTLRLVFIPVVLVTIGDLSLRYPRDINVPLPQALFFYPAIAFVVEVVFHVLPLAVLLFTASRIRSDWPREKVLWGCIIFTALLEPALQMSYEAESFSTRGLFTGFHLVIFNLIQLSIFRRHDLITMYLFRIVYYLYWHIIWGTLRVMVLF